MGCSAAHQSLDVGDMKIETKLRTLGPVNHSDLKAAVCGIHEDAWLEDTIRQQEFKDVHYSTRSIILLFTDLSVWPSIKVNKRKGWDYFANQAQPLVEEIIGKHYPPRGVVMRAMIANLVAGGQITPHIDTDPSFAVGHRIHIPLITNDQVDFKIGGEHFHLREGVAYEVNNLEMHSVHNRSDHDRLHFIFDYAEL